jgi:hypothetical protein
MREINMHKTTNDEKLQFWLEYEIYKSHESESFSRNRESVEYDYGVFAGREEAFKEVLDVVDKRYKNLVRKGNRLYIKKD